MWYSYVIVLCTVLSLLILYCTIDNNYEFLGLLFPARWCCGGQSAGNKFDSHWKPVQICTNLSHNKTVQICTNLSLTISQYKYVQISLSHEAGTNIYKSLSYNKPVQICTNLSHNKPVQICTQHKNFWFSRA